MYIHSENSRKLFFVFSCQKPRWLYQLLFTPKKFLKGPTIFSTLNFSKLPKMPQFWKSMFYWFNEKQGAKKRIFKKVCFGVHFWAMHHHNHHLHVWFLVNPSVIFMICSFCVFVFCQCCIGFVINFVWNLVFWFNAQSPQSHPFVILWGPLCHIYVFVSCWDLMILCVCIGFGIDVCILQSKDEHDTPASMLSLMCCLCVCVCVCLWCLCYVCCELCASAWQHTHTHTHTHTHMPSTHCKFASSTHTYMYMYVCVLTHTYIYIYIYIYI